jgi:hypothetical protein
VSAAEAVLEMVIGALTLRRSLVVCKEFSLHLFQTATVQDILKYACLVPVSNDRQRSGRSRFESVVNWKLKTRWLINVSLHVHIGSSQN